MKYGESTFDILYLLFAIISGIILLIKGSNKSSKMMGAATLVLGLGDAFHLVPRVLNYFIDTDFSLYLGVGKFVTSITMTIFYVLLYCIWVRAFEKRPNRWLSIIVLSLALVRVILCMFPGNGWLSNSDNIAWGIIRNIPFVILGASICYLYFRTRKNNKALQMMWLLILLSFAFYIPVVVGASKVPLLGMLMLPKTIMYILMIVSFIVYTFKTPNEDFN